MSDTKHPTKTKNKGIFGLTPDEIKRYAVKYPELAEALEMAKADGEIAELFRGDEADEAFRALTTDEGNPISCDGDPDNPFYDKASDDPASYTLPVPDKSDLEIITFDGAPKNHPHLVFVYGSLLRGNHNNDRLKDDLFFRDALTKAEYTLYALGPFPGMCEGGKVAVRGELWWVTNDSLKHLDVMEGHPMFYCRTMVELADGQFAWTYIYQMGAHGIKSPPVVESGYWRDHFTAPLTEAYKMEADRKAAKIAARRQRFFDHRTPGTRYYDKTGEVFVYDLDGKRVYDSPDALKATLDSFSSGYTFYDEDATSTSQNTAAQHQHLRLIGTLGVNDTLSTDPLSMLSGRERQGAKKKMTKQEKQGAKKLRRAIRHEKDIPENWKGEIIKWAGKVSENADRPLSTWSDKK